MLLEWISHLGLLKQDPESNVLASFPPAVRRAIAIETVASLHQTGMATAGICADTINTSAATSFTSAPVTTANTYALPPIPSNADSKVLPTYFHVRFITEIISEAFNLPLEDMNTISNAAAIYIQWLVEPNKRPAAVIKGTVAEQQQFIQLILCHVSLLFQPKKIDNSGSAKTLLASLAGKHVEVCKSMLRAISQVAIEKNIYDNDERVALSASTWKVLLRVLLGVTDSLLRLPCQPYAYLTEELGEALLSTLLELWLRSELFSLDLWMALKSCYPGWNHRLIAITHWSAICLAVTQRITKLLYDQGTHAVVYTVHSNLVTIELSDQYIVYAWHQLLGLTNDPTNLMPSIFFRAVIGIEKLVQIFHSISSPKAEDAPAIERHFPDGNTILSIFGDWLFKAVSRTDSDGVEGRAQAYGILCRIFTRPQFRNPFSPTYLHQFYSAILDGLKGDLMPLVFIVVNCEDLFALDLPGVRILSAPFIMALRRLIPELEKPLRISLNFDDLRRACYKLLCTIYECCAHYADIPLIEELFFHSDIINKTTHHTGTMALASSSPAEELSSRSPFAQVISNHQVQFYIDTLDGMHATFLETGKRNLGSCRYLIIELFIRSFVMEKDPGNMRYLVNALTTFTISDASSMPGLIALVVNIFEDFLVSARWPPDVCLVVIGSLCQLAPFQTCLFNNHPDSVRRLIFSLSNLISLLISRNNLSVLLKQIHELIDCMVSWIIGPDASSSFFAYDLECQASVIQTICKAIYYGTSINRRQYDTLDTTSPLPKKNFASIPPSPQTPLVISPTHSAGLYPSIGSGTAKSLEAHLSLIGEIALSKIIQHFAIGRINDFYPSTLSSLSLESDFLLDHWHQDGENKEKDKDEGQEQRQEKDKKSLHNIPEKELSHLRLYFINDHSLVSFLEVDNDRETTNDNNRITNDDYKVPQLSTTNSLKITSLFRSVMGRHSWRHSLKYASFSSSSSSPPNETFTFDLNNNDTFVSSTTESENSASSYIMADSYKLQQMLIENSKELESFPINLEASGPIFNDSATQARFSLDEKRLLNYKCVENLIKLQTAASKPNFKALFNRNQTALSPSKEDPKSHLSRLLLSHCGLVSLDTRGSIVRVPVNSQVLNDIETLDTFYEREFITCMLLFVKSGRQALKDIVTTREFSVDFIDFVHSLAWPVDPTRYQSHALQKYHRNGQASRKSTTSPFNTNESYYNHPSYSSSSPSSSSSSSSPFLIPYYADNNVEMVFNIIQGNSLLLGGISNLESSTPPSATMNCEDQNLVCIVWIEELEEMLALPSKLQTRAIVYICISPQSQASSAGLYRIRIMVTSSATLPDTVFLFGPLLDGMIIRRESLGVLVRETAISASLFCLYNIQGYNRPLIRRAHFFQQLLSKYRHGNTSSGATDGNNSAQFYNELIYNAGA